MALKYPETRTVDHFDDYHGTRVADPYRWLEESADLEQVSAWITRQNELTRSQLDTDPHRAEIVATLNRVWDYAKRSPPHQRGGRWFQFRNTGLQNQNVLYVLEEPEDEGRVLLDPNTLSEDGTTSLLNWEVSPDGSWLAYSVSEGGSDWSTWYVLDIDSGELQPHVVRWSRFSGASWLPDSSGFFYSRYPEPPEGQEYLIEMSDQRVHLHRLGSDQAEDALVYERPDDPKLGFHAEVSDDGRWLVLLVWRGTEPKNYVYVRELDPADPLRGEFLPLVPEFRADYRFMGNDGARLYFQTDDGAERQRVVAIDVKDPASVRTILPEQEDLLDHCVLLGDTIIATHLKDASHRLSYWSLNGERLGEAELPALGTVYLNLPDRHAGRAFIEFTSFVHPRNVLETGSTPDSLVPFWEPRVAFDPGPYEATQEFATSRDGTRVPMFIVGRRGMKRDGSNPTVLYGYGGFSINLTPEFSPSRIAWLEQGGTLVVANLRGGLEYGKSWHEAGILERKQNVFDDFVACAEHLIATGVTSPSHLGIQGGSNGGLLVGACMTQRPELFGAVHAAVGVLDMLRYHRFTIGWAWASDYGSSDDAEQFAYLYRYSPLHNLKPGTCYPATLLTTGDRDDRVVPGHSFKFAAALQAAQGCERPVLLRVQTRTGHGHGKPTALVIDEQADIWTFMLANLG